FERNCPSGASRGSLVSAGFPALDVEIGLPVDSVGVAFASLQFAYPRTRTQIVLGLAVALAFILWGTEQFLSNRGLVSFIDDVVVFLFVLDLSIVVYGHLRPGLPSAHSNLPFDGPDE